MTRSEFDQQFKVQSLGDGNSKAITDEQYKAIEMVYTYHPSISETDGKAQIAYLVVNYGMAIIYDMLPRAERACQIEQTIMAKKSEIRGLDEELENLKVAKTFGKEV